MKRTAKRLRAAGNTNIYAPEELRERKWDIKEVLSTMARPFIMFATEPIVLVSSPQSLKEMELIIACLSVPIPVIRIQRCSHLYLP